MLSEARFMHQVPGVIQELRGRIGVRRQGKARWHAKLNDDLAYLEPNRLKSPAMRARRILMRILGGLYILAGLANLFGLTDPEIRALIISLGAVVLRYSLYIVVGVGMVLLRKWSAYVLALSFLLNTVVFFTVYSGQSGAVTWYVSLVGPVLLVALYYYAWPALHPATEPKPPQEVT